MSEQNAVELFLCKRCSKQLFDDEMAKGIGCKRCGGMQVGYAPASTRFVFGHLMHYPSQIPQYIRENIFGSDSIHGVKRA